MSQDDSTTHSVLSSLSAQALLALGKKLGIQAPPREKKSDLVRRLSEDLSHHVPPSSWLRHLTVKELRSAAQLLGASAAGRKAELVERLDRRTREGTEENAQEETYLRELALTNFRCLSSASLRFCSGVNVIIGDNGTGKTACFAGIRAGLGAFIRSFYERGPNVGLDPSDIRNLAEKRGDRTVFSLKLPCLVSCQSHFAGELVEWERAVEEREVSDADELEPKRADVLRELADAVANRSEALARMDEAALPDMVVRAIWDDIRRLIVDVSSRAGVLPARFRSEIHDAATAVLSALESPAAAFRALSFLQDSLRAVAESLREDSEKETRTQLVTRPKSLTNVIRRFKEGEKRGEHKTLPLIASYGAQRLWFREGAVPFTSVQAGTPFEGYRHALDEYENRDYEVWFAAMEERLRVDGTAPLSLLTVRRALTKCVHGWSNFRFDFEARTLVADSEDGLQTLPVHLLSEGTRNVLALVADLARRAALLNPHLGANVLDATPGIVAIDEIDLHLHPNWQRRVLGDLRVVFPKVQFIVTTHSPFVLQSLVPGDCVISLPTFETVQPADPGGIEDIAEDLMGVDHPQQSARRRKMHRLAREFLEMVKQGRQSSEAEEMRRQWRLLRAEFGNVPGYLALLELEALRHGLGPLDDETR